MFAAIFPTPTLRTKASILSSIFLVVALSHIPVSAKAQEFMTQSELLETIPGQTIQGKSKDGTLWAQAYGAGTKKGKIKGVFGGSKYDAQWYVEGDKWCENWGDGQACWSVERVDDRSLRMYDTDGTPRKNLWVLQK